ncbi:hypothetical protein IL992_41140 [Microbispora sp. NEAU-D428]|uniref:hypothetical protein n=1 Tax=Microbispora sitophila TaxID=2771537 RepID=UPI0018660D93|nr:hypothetical protein [Microbispora sitophila]MBE3015525.1 hypothetical protein [Microbispora sitophila]
MRGHVPEPLIALISAVPAAIAPIDRALRERLPMVRVWNLIDDRLMEDAAADGGVTPRLARRMRRLIDHAVVEGADAVVLTCSLYAGVAHEVAGGPVEVPVLGPDDALVAAVVAGGCRNVLLVSPAAGPLADSRERLRRAAGPDVTIAGVVADGAAEAARRGDEDALTRSVLAAIEGATTGHDVIVLGQYSLAPAGPVVRGAVTVPVLTGPGLTADLLARTFAGADT